MIANHSTAAASRGTLARMRAVVLCLLLADCGGGSAAPDAAVPLDGAATDAFTDGAACPSGVSLTGQIFDFVTGMPVPAATTHVAVFDPLDFVAGGAGSLPLAAVDAQNGRYVTPCFAPPTSHGLAVLFGGDAVTTTVVESLTVSPGGAYLVDGWTLAQSVVGSWSSAAGVDFGSTGAMVFQFCDDAAPPTPSLSLAVCHRAAGVQLSTGAGPAHYLDPTPGVLSPSLTTTGALGLAVTTPLLAPATATGGDCDAACTWPALGAGATASHYVYFVRVQP